VSARQRTDERAAEFVSSWCRWYTRGLPEDAAQTRYEELHSDLFDQRADATEIGASSAQAARAILVRAARGVPADLSWRTHQLRAARSARAQERSMNDTAISTGATTTARVLAALVAAWAVFAAIAQGATSDGTAWAIGTTILFTVGAALALYGVWVIGRRPVSGAMSAAAAAVLTTAPLWWSVIIPVLGVAVAAGLIVYAVSAHRAGMGTV
jgi:hypothetical protein